MRIFLTGGTGYIGSELCRRLVEQGHEVRALVRSTSDTRRLDKIGAALFVGDITDRYSMREAMSGADWVVHAAADRAIWVTVVPHLRRFCRELEDRSRLIQRLEQRLGMPPASNKTVFVEILLENPATALFRPCADPRPIEDNTKTLPTPSL